MLHEVAINRDTILERTVPVGYSSRWSLALRVRKQLVLVCRAWWAAGISDIYANVYLHRVGQLPALVRVLEESAICESRTNEGEAEGSVGQPLSCDTGARGYGHWVTQITMDFHLPRSWLNVYREGTNRLLKLCPNLRSLVHRPIHSHPLFTEPLSIGFEDFLLALTNAVECRESIYPCDDRKPDPVVTDMSSGPLSCLEHLTIGEPLLVPQSLGQQFVDVFKNLTSLELSLSRLSDSDVQSDFLKESSEEVTIVFPHLHTFAVAINRGEWSSLQLERISKVWCMPKLVRLFILEGDALAVTRHRPLDALSLPDPRVRPMRLQDINGVCSAHGDNLRHLYIGDTSCGTLDVDSFMTVLDQCPQLCNLTFRCSTWLASVTPPSGAPASAKKWSHTNLEIVTMVLDGFPPPEEENRLGTDRCTSIILELRIREKFPALKVVRVANQDIDDLYGCPSEGRQKLPPSFTSSLGGHPNVDLAKCRLSPTARQHVLQWAGMLSSVGVSLENHSHRRISPPFDPAASRQTTEWTEIAQAIEEIGVLIGECNIGDDTSDGSYEYESASTASYEDSDVAEDSLLEHDIDGEECLRCKQDINSEEHSTTMWWLESTTASTKTETSLTCAEGISEDGAAMTRQSKDEGQVGWDDALERFEESLERTREWYGDNEEDESYEAVSFVCDKCAPSSV